MVKTYRDGDRANDSNRQRGDESHHRLVGGTTGTHEWVNRQVSCSTGGGNRFRRLCKKGAGQTGTRNAL